VHRARQFFIKITRRHQFLTSVLEESLAPNLTKLPRASSVPCSPALWIDYRPARAGTSLGFLESPIRHHALGFPSHWDFWTCVLASEIRGVSDLDVPQRDLTQRKLGIYNHEEKKVKNGRTSERTVNLRWTEGRCYRRV